MNLHGVVTVTVYWFDIPLQANLSSPLSFFSKAHTTAVAIPQDESYWKLWKKMDPNQVIASSIIIIQYPIKTLSILTDYYQLSKQRSVNIGDFAATQSRKFLSACSRVLLHLTAVFPDSHIMQECLAVFQWAVAHTHISQYPVLTSLL